MSVQDLPTVNAACNAVATLFLVAGYAFIRRGQRTAHRNCMIGALAASALFLAGYLTYHFSVPGVTRFRDPAWFRPIYLALLFTHTVLAAVIVPMVVTTVLRAARGRFELHKKLARWTWPLWVYVSITGVLIYLLLYRIFPQR